MQIWCIWWTAQDSFIIKEIWFDIELETEILLPALCLYVTGMLNELVVLIYVKNNFIAHLLNSSSVAYGCDNMLWAYVLTGMTNITSTSINHHLQLCN